MYCENCGHQNSDFSLFCIVCGARMPEPDDDAPVDEITPYVNGMSYSGTVKSRRKRAEHGAQISDDVRKP